MAEVERAKPFSDIAKGIARRISRDENVVLIVVLLALIAGMSVITKGLTSSRANILNILIQSSTVGVAAAGEAFVVLSGGIDISVGGIALSCSVLGTSLMTSGWQNIIGYPVSMYIGIPVMLLAGVGWGMINGAGVSRIGVGPIITTLAMWQISTGVAFQICKGYTVYKQPEGLRFLGSGRVAGIPVPIIIFIVTVMIGYFVLNHTTFGRSVYAVGGNRVSAWLSGIKVKNIQFLVYVISGFLAGVAAVIMLGRVMSSSMVTLAGLEIDAISAVFIGGVSLAGGKGNLMGVLIGVLIIGAINNGMSVLGASPAVQGIVKGVIIFTAVAIDNARRRG